MKLTLLAYTVYASFASGLPLPEEPPLLQRVPPCTLNRIAYGAESEAACLAGGGSNLAGIYPYDSPAVYIRDDIDPRGRYFYSILLHEIVHYVQFEAWQKDPSLVDSECRPTRERQAYEIQFDFIRRVWGVDPYELTNLDRHTVEDITQDCAGRTGGAGHTGRTGRTGHLPH